MFQNFYSVSHIFVLSISIKYYWSLFAGQNIMLSMSSLLAEKLFFSNLCSHVLSIFFLIFSEILSLCLLFFFQFILLQTFCHFFFYSQKRASHTLCWKQLAYQNGNFRAYRVVFLGNIMKKNINKNIGNIKYF